MLQQLKTHLFQSTQSVTWRHTHHRIGFVFNFLLTYLLIYLHKLNADTVSQRTTEACGRVDDQSSSSLQRIDYLSCSSSHLVTTNNDTCTQVCCFFSSTSCCVRSSTISSKLYAYFSIMLMMLSIMLILHNILS